MNTIAFYLDKAKQIHNLKSDRKLSIFLGFNEMAVGFWRRGEKLPNEKSMIKLAEIAGVSMEQALLELSYMRAKHVNNDVAMSTYLNIIRKVVGAIAIVAFMGLCGSAEAATLYDSNLNINNSGNIHYHTLRSKDDTFS